MIFPKLRVSLALVLILMCYLLSGCVPPPPPPPSELVYIWASSVKDSYVWSLQPDTTHQLEGWINASCQSEGQRRVYMEFLLPPLPAGSIVQHAYINVYEQGSPNPGSVTPAIGLAVAEWDPATLTWNSQPNAPGPMSAGVALQPFQGNDQWHGSHDLRAEVQKHLDDPSSNNGWIIADHPGTF